MVKSILLWLGVALLAFCAWVSKALFTMEGIGT